MEGAIESEGYKIPVVATMCKQKPHYKPLARTLLPIIREYFQDPANEAEFQEWLAEKNRKKGAAEHGAALDG